ncbi:MAG: class I SAM-dependent methyltransferase [Gammaproteobacteria bacterium]|nr:class I SAM-dependent methyltransferase [Gammaproteobacteria bacterium]
MSLKFSYTLISPIYDMLIAGATRKMRQKSWSQMGEMTNLSVLIPGVGTGLDIPYLPKTAHYTGIDLTPAMLHKARKRTKQHKLSIALREGDILALNHSDQTFDRVVMHLILAVVPSPQLALQEAARVLKPGGHITILDKFIRPGESAPVRRIANGLLRHIATRTDVIFEEVLADVPALQVVNDEPLMAGGWFRRIELQKQATRIG